MDWRKQDLSRPLNAISRGPACPDSRVLATASTDRTAQLWDVVRRQRQACLEHDTAVLCVALSPDKRTLAAGADNGEVILWDTVRSVRLLSLGPHRAGVNSLAFAPDDRTMATGSFDRTVRLWDVATAQEVMTLEGHTGKVHCLAFARDGRLLVSGGETAHDSGEVYFWQAALPAAREIPKSKTQISKP